MALGTNSFVEFPQRESLLRRLRRIEVYQPSMDSMFQLVSDRLDHKAYDRSAFVFILLELIYEYDEYERDAITFGDLLGRMVFALTEDLDLVGEALEAFEEVRETLDPNAEPLDLGGVDEEEVPQRPEDELWDPVADQEQLMLELQLAQKKVTDFGLDTRASIEQSLARPNRANVGQTLRQISQLRTSLLEFEQLLKESEEHILEAIGILEQD